MTSWVDSVALGVCASTAGRRGSRVGSTVPDVSGAVKPFLHRQLRSGTADLTPEPAHSAVLVRGELAGAVATEDSGKAELPRDMAERFEAGCKGLLGRQEARRSPAVASSLAGMMVGSRAAGRTSGAGFRQGTAACRSGLDAHASNRGACVSGGGTWVRRSGPGFRGALGVVKVDTLTVLSQVSDEHVDIARTRCRVLWEVTMSRPYKKWSKEEVVRTIKEMRRRGEPLNAGFVARHHPTVTYAARKYAGGWAAAVSAAGLDYEQFRRKCVWSRGKVIAQIKELHAAGEPLHVSRVERDYGGLVGAAAEHIGSWARAIEAAGLDYSTIRRQREWSRATILAEIRRTHKEGMPLATTAEVRRRYRTLHAASVRYFGSWAAAVKRARLGRLLDR